MTNKKKCGIFPWYISDEKQKGKLHYISFKFICLCLYIIGFYYVFLNISLENKSLGIVGIYSVYERNLGEAEKNKGSRRKKNLKDKKKDASKTKTNTNNIICNKQKVEENKYSTNNDLRNTTVENKSNSSISNINYNDLSKNLTENELHAVLNSLETCPSKEDLRNIWTHTIGVVKEGLDDIQKQLQALIQKYLDNDIHFGGIECGGNRTSWLYGDIWNETRSGFCRTVGSVQLEYTNDFYRLINDKHTLDDILKFIYSFLEHFKTLKKELHEYHKKELLGKMEKALHLWKHREKKFK